jgi:hypothetical protein
MLVRDRQEAPLPKLIRFYIKHVLIGFAIAVAFVAGLLAFDVAGLRHLILNSADGPLALGLLVFSNGIVFAGVQFAIAVMGLAEDGGRGKGPGRRIAAFRRAIPIVIRAAEQRTIRFRSCADMPPRQRMTAAHKKFRRKFMVISALLA